jgi:hypothetical protein
MRTSYDDCLAELERAGLAPAGQRRDAVRARRAPSFDIFAKSEPRVARHTDHFSALVHELGTILDSQKQRAARVRAGRQHEQEFSKALRSLDDVRRTYLRPIIIRADALNKRPRPAETIAKAFAALQSSALTPAQRGRLMLSLSGVADQFVKSHPLIADIDDIRAKLDRALADGHAGDSAPVIREALALIDRGRITPADHMRLSMLLNEIRSRLNEVSDAQKD